MSLGEFFRKKKLVDISTVLNKTAESSARARVVDEEEKLRMILELELRQKLLGERVAFHQDSILPLFKQTLSQLEGMIDYPCLKRADTFRGSNLSVIGCWLKWGNKFESALAPYQIQFSMRVDFSGEFLHLLAISDPTGISPQSFEKDIKLCSEKRLFSAELSDEENRQFFIRINNEIASFLKTNIVSVGNEVHVRHSLRYR